jgi:ketosteroid isomerase-like protein
MDTTERELDVVLRWHDAVNHRDTETIRDLTTADVRMVGPRGSERGQEMLVGWIHRSGIRLTVRAHHVTGNAIVVEEDAQWEGDPEIHRVATVFRLTNGLISEIGRHATLEDAMRHA